MLLSPVRFIKRIPLQLKLLLLGVVGFPKELSCIWTVYRERRVKRLHAQQRAAIAKMFNDRYTYWQRWVEDQPIIGVGMFGMDTKGGWAWMCPDCNKIHLAAELTCFTGVQYPACCTHPKGHRLNSGIFTPPTFAPGYKTRWYGPTV